MRQHLSSYAWDHYAEFDPDEPKQSEAGSIARLLDRVLADVNVDDGPSLDVGCSVGRTCFELAGQSDGLVLGVDLNFPMLQLAQRVLESRTVTYDRRRVGVVYDRRAFPVSFTGVERVDFWCCDSQAMPFRAGRFSQVSCLNVVDCVQNPIQLLQQVANMLRANGTAIVATPFDWSSAATPFETWLGGHSDRAPHRGASEVAFRSVLEAGGLGLSVEKELDGIPWQVRLHDRSSMHYDVHATICRRG